MSAVGAPAPAPERSGCAAACCGLRAIDIGRSASSSAWSSSPLFLPLIVLLPPFNSFSGQAVWIDGFTNAGVFVLLALGLNIVVGMSGLLDLGYAAFFAIGAYTYAFAASSVHRTSTCPFWPMLLVGAGVAAIFGIMLGAPTLRLRGDYLAIVTLGFGEIVPIAIENSSKYTEGPERHRRHLAAIDRWARLPDDRQPVAVLHHDGRPDHRLDDPDLPTPGFAAGTRLDGDPRGRARRGGQRHQHRRDEAARLRARGVTAGLAGVFIAAKLQTVTPEPVPLRRVVHGPGHGRPRRHGERLGRGCRRLRRSS